MNFSAAISNSKQSISDFFAAGNPFETSQKLFKSTQKANTIQSQYLTKSPSKPELKSIHPATSLPQFSSLSALDAPPVIKDKHILRLCRAGQLEEAVAALESLARHGGKVDPKTYIFLLHSCIDRYSIETGRKLHALLDSVCDSDLFLQTKLVGMYAKCGSLEEARRVFARMSERNLFTWSAMIDACARKRRWAEILVLFASMVAEDVTPDAFLLPKIIRACANSGNVEMGELAHSVAVRSGLDSSVYVRKAILAMYAKCGKLQAAKRMFQKIVERSPGMWNTMISVSCQSGENEDAMMLFNQMQAEGVRPNLVTWNTVISTCNQAGECGRAMELMEEMESSGISPDVFTWSYMISGSAQNNRNQQAVDLFRGMLLAGTEPNNVAIASVVSACTSLKDFKMGELMHSVAVKLGLGNDVLVGNSMIDFYAECEMLEEAERAFQKLAKSTQKAYAIQSLYQTKSPSKPELKSIHLTTSHSPSVQGPPPGVTDRHILHLCQAGHLKEAVTALESLALNGGKVEPKTYMFLLHSCIDWYSIETGRKLHALLDSVCESDSFLQTRLVSMYSKCGSLEEARQVFARISERNLFTWSAMIGAYAREQQWAEILVLFAQMVGDGATPDVFLLPKIIQACANLGNVEMGELAHSVAVRSGMDSSVYVRNAILAMYAKCGKLQSAKKMFEKIAERSPDTWNTMISVSCQSGKNEDAMMLFNQMQAEGLKPNLVTWNTVISIYNQSGECDRAMELMEEMESSGISPDVFTWTSMISGSAQNNRNHQAIELFRGMLLAFTEPNNVTIASVVSACASLKDFQMGELMHSVAVKLRHGNDVLVGNSLIDFYAKCEMLEDAERVFDQISEPDVCSWNSMIGGYMQAGNRGKAHNMFEEMPCSGIQRNVVTWNVMISGYIQNGDEDLAMDLFRRMEMDGVKQSTASWNLLIAGYTQNSDMNKALMIFRQMQFNNMRPDSITILSVLPACENLLAASKVKEIHACILHSNLDCEVSIMNLLIFAYAKSGDLVSAKFIFDSLSLLQKDLITWNSMLSGYVLHGQSELAIEHINQMKQSGMKPNHAVVTNMISVYSLAGMVDEGKELFSSMTQDYQICPGLEHYAGIVDLLGRSGRLREAMDFINSMPFEPNSAVWSAFLTACRIHRNISFAKKAAEYPILLEPDLSVVNMLFLQIHVLGGSTKEASDVRKCRRWSGSVDSLECSWIEVKNTLYKIHSGDQSLPQSELIYAQLHSLARAVKNDQLGPHDMQPWLEEEEEEEIIGIHSEKLAVAFALIGNPAFRRIRIIKNLRMCSSCHNVAKLISRLHRREIFLKDPNCLHHFKNGQCSCKDYW